LLGQGGTTAEACRPRRSQRADLLSLAQGIWRPEDGSGAADEGSGEENLRLRCAISDLMLDKLILQEAAKGNF